MHRLTELLKFLVDQDCNYKFVGGYECPKSNLSIQQLCDLRAQLHHHIGSYRLENSYLSPKTFNPFSYLFSENYKSPFI